MEDVPTGNGIDLGTTVELPRTLTDAGVNAFDITAGMQCCFELMTPPPVCPGVERRHQRRCQGSARGQGAGHAQAGFPTPTPPNGSYATV